MSSILLTVSLGYVDKSMFEEKVGNTWRDILIMHIIYLPF